MKFNENPSVGAELFHVNEQMKHRQTNMTKSFAIFRTHLDKNVKTAINKVHGQN